MSTLSSEVIADAVGHAMQHKPQVHSNHGVGRGRSSMGGLGSGDGSSGGLRARSRSRVRNALLRDM